jgi:P-type Cu+ transporter
VPADGEVVEGQGFLDEALITGESLPVTKGPGDRLIGGSINTEGLFIMKVTGIGEVGCS